MGKKIDLIGKRFGKLVVIDEAGRYKNGEILWKCDCDCGKSTIVIGGSLKRGTTKSCGCLNKELVSERKTKKIDPGERFGWLTVKRRVGSTKWKGNKRAIYLCQCICGNETEADSSRLRSDNEPSCGCKNKGISRMNTPENMIRKKKTRKETDWVENTSLSAISPSRKKANGKSSKTIGVHKNSRTGLWVAQLVLKGERVLYEYFSKEQDAINARKEAEVKYFSPILGKYSEEQKNH